MLGAGLRELCNLDDIEYMIEKLDLDNSAKNAARTLRKELDRSLRSTSRCIDNLIHNVKHGKR